MKRNILAVVTLILAATSAQAQDLSAKEIADRHLHHRAVEAVIWGMAAVNTDLMLQEMLTKTSGKVNQIAPARLAQPDAHAESRRDLLHGVLQHEGVLRESLDAAGRRDVLGAVKSRAHGFEEMT